jgi:hypothetical protein
VEGEVVTFDEETAEFLDALKLSTRSIYSAGLEAFQAFYAQQGTIKVSELDKLEKTLKQHKVFDDLVDLAEKHKIDRAKFSNLDKVIAKLFADWDGAQDDLHLFITLLEIVREKRGVEHELKQIRLERAAGSSRRKTEE